MEAALLANDEAVVSELAEEVGSLIHVLTDVIAQQDINYDDALFKVRVLGIHVL